MEKFPQDVFTTLADLLTYDWEKFARCLSVDDSAIDKVKKEFDSTRKRTIHVLNQWREENPSKQWRDLKTGLIFCNRQDLVGECERSRIFYFINHTLKNFLGKQLFFKLLFTTR